MSEIEFKWEDIEYSNHCEFSYRAKVIGGWVYRLDNYECEDSPIQTSLVFIPDLKHEWKIKEPLESK